MPHMTAFRAALVAAAIALPAAAFAQAAAPAVGQTMDPPGTAELKAQLAPAPKAAKPKAAKAKPVAKPTAAAQAAVPAIAAPAPALAPAAAAAPVQSPAVAAGAAAGAAAGKPVAVKKPKAKAAKTAAAKPADAVESKPIAPPKKTKGKKGAKAAVAAPAPIDPAAIASPATGRLTGQAAWAKLVGNSINGMYNGSSLTEAYLPDNTVKTRNGGETTVGRWGFVDGRACFQYPAEQQASCYDVAIEGDEVAYTDEDGQVFHFTMNQGIPNGM